ncbi:hypothetical protein YC2023_001180 [Brassica napus]
MAETPAGTSLYIKTPTICSSSETSLIQCPPSEQLFNSTHHRRLTFAAFLNTDLSADEEEQRHQAWCCRCHQSQ